MANKNHRPVLSMVLANQHVWIEILNRKRLKDIGFGAYLENAKPGEILISPEAKAAILNQPYRSGPQGMEVFEGNTLAFCSLAVPVNMISVHKVAKEWFRQCAIVKEPD